MVDGVKMGFGLGLLGKRLALAWNWFGIWLGVDCFETWLGWSRSFNRSYRIEP